MLYMPHCDVIDRYTILAIKLKYFQNENNLKIVQQQIEPYEEEIKQLLGECSGLPVLLGELYQANWQLWLAESEMTELLDNTPSDAAGAAALPISRCARNIRNLNKNRHSVKDKITDLLGQNTQEIRENY